MRPHKSKQISSNETASKNEEVKAEKNVIKIIDNRKEASVQRKLLKLANDSLTLTKKGHENRTQKAAQLLKISSAINALFTEQVTSMSCWAAALACITGAKQADIIARYRNERYSITGLPPQKDSEALGGDYGLTKYNPWTGTVNAVKYVAMVALPQHWVVTYGVEVDDDSKAVKKILYFDPLDGSKNEVTVQQFNALNPTIAYSKA